MEDGNKHDENCTCEACNSKEFIEFVKFVKDFELGGP